MNSIILFESKNIRRAWNEQEQKWYFSVQDVLEALTESSNIKQYIKKMKSRDPELNSYWGTICTPVEMATPEENYKLLQQQQLEACYLEANREVDDY